MNLLETIELALESKLTRKGFLQGTVTPNGYCGFTLVVVAKMDKTNGVLHFFDSNTINQFDFGLWLYIYILQHGKGGGNILDTAIELNLWRDQYASVGIDAAHPAETIAFEQQLFFELDFTMA